MVSGYPGERLNARRKETRTTKWIAMNLILKTGS